MAEPYLNDTPLQSAPPTGDSAAPAPPPPRPSRLRRALLWLAYALLAALVALALALAAGWWWLGQSHSLAATLSRVASWMPAGQTLQAREVEGSVRHGGTIGWLRWSSPTLQVEVDNATVGWRLPPLLSRELRVGKVHIATLRIRSTPDPKAGEQATQPLQAITLPVRVDLPFEVEEVVWEGPPEVKAQQLQGHYRYTGGKHQLALNSLHWSQGQYAAQLTLQGAAPMALQARLRGHIHTPLPEQDMRLLTLATAEIEGTLAGEDAQLHVHAQAYAKDVVQSDTPPATVSPTEEDEADIANSQTLRALIKADLRPWRPQPVESALVDLHAVDVSLFWPQGPRTLLSGEVHAGPNAQGWDVRADLRNAIPGPWDVGSLPVHHIAANITQQGNHWTVQEAQINLGTGHLTAQGSFDSDQRSVQGQAVLHQVSPAALWSTLDPTPLKGTISARTSGGTHAASAADTASHAATPAPAPATTNAPVQVDFEVDIAGSQGPATGRAARSTDASSLLRIDSIRTRGSWQAPHLALRDLHVRALQAQLDSPTLSFHTETMRAAAQATLTAPGAQLQLQGHISPDEGAGRSQLALQSAADLQRWVQQLPGLQNPLAGGQLAGTAQANVQWQGGWKRLLERLQSGAMPPPTTGVQLQAEVSSRELRWTPSDPAAPATRIAPLQLTAQGTPEQMALQLSAQAAQGTQHLDLQTKLSAGLATARGSGALDWDVRAEQLQARWQPDTKRSQHQWRAELTSPLTLAQRTSGRTALTRRIDASAGQLRIYAPIASEPAAVQWQPVVLRHSAQGAWQVQSQGLLEGVPLAWVDAFSTNPLQAPLAAAGISGDLTVKGTWNIDTTPQAPRVEVILERASGDIRLAMGSEDPPTANVNVVRSEGAVARRVDGSVRPPRVPGRGMRAGIEQLRVQLQLQGQDVRTQVLWRTTRAGQLQADLRTRIGPLQEGFDWPTTAPLSGTVQASLPDVGVWAMFAPPGWRVTGSMNADVRIAGTRTQPRWDGTLGADGLSITSLLDGLDLQGGRMRARLQGTRMDITELSLQGGTGSSARILGYSGNLTPASPEGGSLSGTGFAQWNPDAPAGTSGMALQLQLQAQQLQVLVRADRQLSTSGSLSAQLNNGQLVLRGDLTVDRAAILLPDQSAPSLDKDVVVHSAASRQAQAQQEARVQAAKEAQEATAGATATTAKVPDIAVNINLGQDFALQGLGITTRLRGALQVRGATTPGGPPHITGTIRTEQGRYRAWGQSLDVESGQIRFNGPYNDPSLDIIAIRPNITVRAGARVTGSALAPRVALFSEPEMSDAEKLSWIVMGRDTTNGGAEAALLQQAALALLSGGGTGENFAGRLGLDEIGIRGPADPTDSSSAAAVTLGKRLSKDLYVSYEQSLNGAMGTLYIFYDLSRRLTLRGQTGEQTAVDLIYTMRKD